jgi:hypothetical protein
MASGDVIERLVSAMGLSARRRLVLLTVGTILLFSSFSVYVFIVPLNLWKQLPQSLRDLSGIAQSVGVTVVITFMLATWIFSSSITLILREIAMPELSRRIGRASI